MLELAFWYIFFGVLLTVEGVFYIFMPKEVKRMIKGITRRVSTMRMIGFSYIFFATLMWYSATFSDGVAANVLLALSYLVLAKSVVLIYMPKWCRKNVVKSFLGWKDFAFQAMGIVILAAGIFSALYGALYV